jgi:hypothetical protein
MPRTVVRAAVDPFARFEADKLAVEELSLAAIEASRGPRSGGGSKDLDAIAALQSFAQRAYLLLQSLDTTAEGDLIFQLPSTRSPESDGRGDALAAVDSATRRLAGELRRELDRLSCVRGPDPRLSLPFLVAKLCDLWERETGSAVTVNPYEKTAYTGAPQSEAGAFVCRVVETLQPTLSEISDRMNWSGRASAPKLT